MTNFEIFKSTVDTFANSQGFYSRLQRNLNQMNEKELEVLKSYLNAQPQWNDTLDCVLFLEQ